MRACAHKRPQERNRQQAPTLKIKRARGSQRRSVGDHECRSESMTMTVASGTARVPAVWPVLRVLVLAHFAMAAAGRSACDRSRILATPR
eukprot:scaffold24900_cov132-Isochrysis_galbana.AAC.1